ncbi:MAG: hypothetical protein NE334_03115 [Lentisphaeraceae bacterium]|nr:hypothetical protein [Lentisphaeraceae bacterium]
MISVRDIKVDRTSFAVTSLQETDEKEYWRAKSPIERLEEVELNRKIVFGYDTAPRLQRLLEVVKPS